MVVNSALIGCSGMGWDWARQELGHMDVSLPYRNMRQMSIKVELVHLHFLFTILLKGSNLLDSNLLTWMKTFFKNKALK